MTIPSSGGRGCAEWSALDHTLNDTQTFVILLQLPLVWGFFAVQGSSNAYFTLAVAFVTSIGSSFSPLFQNEPPSDLFPFSA